MTVTLLTVTGRAQRDPSADLKGTLPPPTRQKHMPIFASERYSKLKKEKAQRMLLIYWDFTDHAYIAGLPNTEKGLIRR
jgi:hypothetical protein